MLAYVDFFLGGDEKRSDLPPRLHQRFPMSIIFGGDGSYMAPFSIQNDNILTSLMSQVCNLVLGTWLFTIAVSPCFIKSCKLVSSGARWFLLPLGIEWLLV